ncbi:MAG TPA: carbohydrate kinase family protein [Rhodocyclaceae bacterium]|nr:MAG: carbohydrate kinase family protein [Betaproteobacteria bacterium CG2_30_68_42]PIX76420.1 MAG: carbohydrate kinase family protein [Rhodocyclales bacterium CG_4_10_14_3_um_filter_68_10]PJA58853.1 MAG: carbohydrate kinase family protein [Rhodocyclales bacterium CG_4_9_14_3_um_filter_68_10]HCX32297.1 carbohydrate kinase family protein [Rhodocyclaceae bacterium]
MSILVCGSIAYDNIMVFRDRFSNHILPSQIHILNVAFLVPDMRREFGGCAGNIAYSLRLLGADPLVMATLGMDGAPYEERLDGLGISRRHLRKVPDTFTAQAFITTDLDDNQITAFHPGAMNHSHLNRVTDADGIRLGIVSPDGREGMSRHAREFHAAGIPFVFDPGQGLPMFDGDELLDFLNLATWCTVNDYEARLLVERTGLAIEALATRVEALVVTLGAQGSTIYTGGQRLDIPCVEPDALVDPTGCGDAYRAGLLYGIAGGLDWLRCGRLASVMGAVKIASRGGQNHSATRDDIASRYRRAFGETLW